MEKVTWHHSLAFVHVHLNIYTPINTVYMNTYTCIYHTQVYMHKHVRMFTACA